VGPLIRIDSFRFSLCWFELGFSLFVNHVLLQIGNCNKKTWLFSRSNGSGWPGNDM
jgi:hypothetical protein